MSDEEERKFRCTKCGRIGTVGRCCGLDTLVAICKENSVKDIDLSDLANFPPPPDSEMAAGSSRKKVHHEPRP